MKDNNKIFNSRSIINCNAFKILFLTLLFFARTYINVFAYDIPIATDSRIKTFIYSENEIFRIVLQYGYQTTIEFADDEEVHTISAGNNYAWQISPLQKRLFIKPLEDNVMTNMMLITNKRAYQFELQSRDIDDAYDEELAYVVRFFYPDEQDEKMKPDFLAHKNQIHYEDKEVKSAIKAYNFDYTIHRSNNRNAIKADIKVFDNEINTFINFPNGIRQEPKITVHGKKKNEFNIKKVKGYFIINTIAEKITVELKEESITITNNRKKGH